MNKFISQLSPHLFWEMDINTIDPKRSERLIVQRVLEYGLLEDWNNLINYYGKTRVKEIAIDLRNLEDTALSFVSTIFNIEKEKFRCYKHRQSTHQLNAATKTQGTKKNNSSFDLRASSSELSAPNSQLNYLFLSPLTFDL